MKAYNEYMDNISVSDTLHLKFVTCAANARSARRSTTVRRYAAAFACLAVILLGVLTVPRLLQNGVVPTPGGNSPVTPGTVTSAPAPDDKYTLVFNKADSQISANIAIPGHFWNELTNDEVQKVFPNLIDTHTITATANFQSDETGAALFNVDAHAVSADGLSTYIQIAPGEEVVDYILEGDVKTSDVLGTAVTAGYFETEPNSKGEQNVIYFASFKLSGLSYYAELGGSEPESAALRDEFSSLIGTLIKEGAADLSIFDSPVIPELRNDKLDMNSASADPDFGAYLPDTIPDGFSFESAVRFINQESNYLSILWTKGMGDIHWSVSFLGEDDQARITSVDDTQNYDLTLYPIPRGESVPRELWTIVNDPIFRIEDLTLEVVQARAYEVSDAGDISGPRMRFGVLYGDILVEINVKGASSEAVLEMLHQIRE